MADRPNRPIRPRGGPGGTGRGRREADPPPGPATVESGVSVRHLSQALGIPAAQIIKIMMGLGKMVQITQSLTDDDVALIAAEVNREITIKHVADEDEEPEVFEDSEADLEA